jgi:Tfp pilus assembly protein PilN
MDLPWNFELWRKDLTVSLMAGTEALGVSLDGTGLTLAHVQQTLKDIQVVQVSRLPYSSGHLDDVAAPFLETVSNWRLESCPVALAVSRDLGFCRRMVFPRAALENLPQVVAYELDRWLPLPADQLYYDFQIQEDTDTEVRVLLMALPRRLVEECLSLFTDAGLRAVAVQLAAVAAGNAFAGSGRPLPASWLLLHLEAGSFELLHLQDSVVQSYEYGWDLESSPLSEHLLDGLAALCAVEPRPRALAVYGSPESDFQVGALKQYDLEIIYPSHLDLPGGEAAVDPDTAIPALGVALVCLGKGLLGINLLPPAERTPIKMTRFSPTTILLAVFLGLFILWGVSALIHTPVKLYRLNRQIAALAPEAQKVEGLLKESRGLAHQMASLRKIGNSADKLKILNDLTRLIPANTWLFSLRLNKQHLEMNGMSKSASDLIPLLAKSGWLDKAEFASPIVTDVNKFEHFKIKANSRGLAPGS